MTLAGTPADTSSTITVERLLPGLSPQAFLDEYYGQRHLHVPGVTFPADVLTVEELESLLRQPDAFDHLGVAANVPDSFELCRLRSVAEIHDAMHQGQTVVMSRLDRLLPTTHPLNLLFDALAEVCLAPTLGVTVFLSPPGAAMPRHHDNYHVFALQLVGSKTWQLFDSADPSHPYGVSYGVDTPQATVEMTAGDLLYVRECQAHQAFTGPEVSLSLGLGYRGAVSSRAAATQDSLVASCAIGPNTEFRRRPGSALKLYDIPEGVLLIGADIKPIRAPVAAAPAIRFIAASDRVFTVSEISSDLVDDEKVELARRLLEAGFIHPVDEKDSSHG